MNREHRAAKDTRGEAEVRMNNGPGARAPGPFCRSSLPPASIVVMVMMVMVVMPMASDHDDRGTPHMAVVMVMMMAVHLSQLDVPFRGFGRRLLIQRLQRLCRIRDRCEQVGVGIRR